MTQSGQHTSARTIEKDREKIITLAHKLAGYEQRYLQMQQKWQSLGQPEQPTLQQRMLYLLLLLAPVALYGLDYFLTGPVAEYFIGGLGFGAWGTELAKLLFPGCILGIEYFLAYKRYTAQDQVEETGQRLPVLGWTLLGVIVCLVVPGFAVYTQYRADPDSLPLILIIGSFSFLIHLAILLGGRQLHDAQIYYLSMFQHLRYEKRVRRLERICNDLRQAVSQTFTRFYRGLKAHAARFPDSPIVQIPLDRITRTVLNNLFGEAPEGSLDPGSSQLYG